MPKNHAIEHKQFSHHRFMCVNRKKIRLANSSLACRRPYVPLTASKMLWRGKRMAIVVRRNAQKAVGWNVWHFYCLVRMPKKILVPSGGPSSSTQPTRQFRCGISKGQDCESVRMFVLVAFRITKLLTYCCCCKGEESADALFPLLPGHPAQTDFCLLMFARRYTLRFCEKDSGV